MFHNFNEFYWDFWKSICLLVLCLALLQGLELPVLFLKKRTSTFEKSRHVCLPSQS